ncbi:(2Fe-2S)-binding protein [Crenalkalicoccus roseus]|uniref:(2Fe-2S)-binding protein n=1 Tax=Crenalkalicoccus roseus TaxID=1485588 RepID=UPI0010813FB4|nr:(2Fe-2S)-binding protein [Crenalkalicoccus roseus]
MVAFTLNGRAAAVELPEAVPLLAALRGPLGLSGPRYGCGAERCGACMVLVENRPAYACTLPLGAAAGKAVRTVEGLGGPEAPHPLQTAFLAEQAGQCGYCLSGILVSAAALLEANPAPDEAAVRAALEPHLCRCGSHNRILRAVLRAAAAMREGRGGAP